MTPQKPNPVLKIVVAFCATLLILGRITLMVHNHNMKARHSAEPIPTLSADDLYRMTGQPITTAQALDYDRKHGGRIDEISELVRLLSEQAATQPATQPSQPNH